MRICVTGPAARPPRRTAGRRVGVGAGVPRGGAAADLDDLGAGADVGGGLVPLGPGGAGVVAAQRLGVGAVEHGEPDGRVEPARRRGGVLRVDGQPGGEDESAVLGGLAQRVDGGPRPLRVDVVDRHRRDAAPVVDAGVEEVAEPVGVGEVRRRLHVHVGGQHQPGQRDRPDVVLGWAGRLVAHGRARLRQEVLDDHLLHVAVPAVARGDRLERVPAGRPRSRRCRPGCRW